MSASEESSAVPLHTVGCFSDSTVTSGLMGTETTQQQQGQTENQKTQEGKVGMSWLEPALQGLQAESHTEDGWGGATLGKHRRKSRHRRGWQTQLMGRQRQGPDARQAGQCVGFCGSFLKHTLALVSPCVGHHRCVHVPSVESDLLLSGMSANTPLVSTWLGKANDCAVWFL